MVKSIDLQELGAILLIYGEIDNPSRRYFNPSLAWHNGQLKIAIRSCNFAVRPHGSWYLRDNNAYSKTDVIYGDVDPDTLQVSNLVKLELSEDSPTRTKVAGLEDVRLFSREDGMHAIGFESDRVTRSLHNASATLAEYLIRDNKLQYVRTLEKPSAQVVEKNWAPTDTPSDTFDFTYSPTQTWKDGKISGILHRGNIHGGSALIAQEDGTYLSVVHEKLADHRIGNFYDRFVYYTYLARHNQHGIITHLTPKLRFGTPENIEFASGMVEHDGSFLISLGIRDCKYAIAKIKREKLINMLGPMV